MAKRNRNSGQGQQLPPVPVSLRLSGKVHKAGRLYAEKCGVSMNALVSMALIDYLRERGIKV